MTTADVTVSNRYSCGIPGCDYVYGGKPSENDVGSHLGACHPLQLEKRKVETLCGAIEAALMTEVPNAAGGASLIAADAMRELRAALQIGKWGTTSSPASGAGNERAES